MNAPKKILAEVMRRQDIGLIMLTIAFLPFLSLYMAVKGG
jgi:hypothetical protein